MNTSNQTYKDLSILYFKEVFDIIDEVMRLQKIPYYLIGANALALELLKKGIAPCRGTKDIDFAIMLSSLSDYDDLIDLLEERGFKRAKAPWTVYSEKFNVAIDILPFGEIEEHDTQDFTDRKSDLHLVGFKEVLASSTQVHIEDKIVQIPPLPGMVILKLVAWSDRPEERDSDLYDILIIIEHYFDFNYDEIVEYHNDTFPEGDNEFDQLKISARVLGRKTKQFLQKSDPLKEKITQLMDRNLITPESSVIARHWTYDREWDIEYAYQILQEFKIGISE
ncbi:MAG: hypothetical protein ACERIH_07095 [Labilibaculum antarcticum]